MYLWLAVTPDEYELIIAVETSAAKLAHRLGTSPCSINNAYKKHYSGIISGRKILKIRVD